MYMALWSHREESLRVAGPLAAKPVAGAQSASRYLSTG